jgi:hypothetical protein
MLAFASDIAMAQRGHRTDRTMQPTELVSDRRRILGRRPIHRAVQRHEAGYCLRDRVVAGPAGIRTELAPSGNRHINDVRLDRAYRMIADTPFVHRPGLEIFDHDIGFGGQLEEDVASFTISQIEAQAALVTIDCSVHETDVRARKHRRQPTTHFAIWSFDFDHVSSEVGQCCRAYWSGGSRRRFDHTHACQRSREIVPGIAKKFCLRHR